MPTTGSRPASLAPSACPGDGQAALRSDAGAKKLHRFSLPPELMCSAAGKGRPALPLDAATRPTTLLPLTGQSCDACVDSELPPGIAEPSREGRHQKTSGWFGQVQGVLLPRRAAVYLHVNCCTAAAAGCCRWGRCWGLLVWRLGRPAASTRPPRSGKQTVP